MATAVQKYAERGFTWMKYHLSPFENVIDQMQAMQAVAPKGFRIHHDITMGGTDDHIFELLEKISQFPIAGCFEDPLPEKGHRRLPRAPRQVPAADPLSPLAAGGRLRDASAYAADGYILGHARIGDAIRHAGLFAELELPAAERLVTITRAMTVSIRSWL
ncbi:MAG: hypothetical protein U0992_08125 [Planctomycetaceae bacterium]